MYLWLCVCICVDMFVDACSIFVVACMFGRACVLCMLCFFVGFFVGGFRRFF